MAWNPAEDEGYQRILEARRIGNPMAFHAKYKSMYGDNPFAYLKANQKRKGLQAVRNNTRATLENVGRQVVSAMRSVGLEQPPATQSVPRPPETEAEVQERDQIRRRYDKQASFVRPLLDDQLQAAFDERTGRVGKFMKNAYSAYGDAEGAVSPLEAAIVRGRYGTVNPILQRFQEEERKRVARRFQDTHSWARKRENLDMLDVAVNYLMSRDQLPEYYR